MRGLWLNGLDEACQGEIIWIMWEPKRGVEMPSRAGQNRISVSSGNRSVTWAMLMNPVISPWSLSCCGNWKPTGLAFERLPIDTHTQTFTFSTLAQNWPWELWGEINVRWPYAFLPEGRREMLTHWHDYSLGWLTCTCTFTTNTNHRNRKNMFKMSTKKSCYENEYGGV